MEGGIVLKCQTRERGLSDEKGSSEENRHFTIIKPRRLITSIGAVMFRLVIVLGVRSSMSFFCPLSCCMSSSKVAVLSSSV